MQKKLIIAVVFYVIVILSTLRIISYLAIHDSIDRLLTNRLVLARIISNHVEVFLNNNLNRLYDLSGKIDLTDGDWKPEKRMLETAYKYSPFTEGVFILDKYGNEVLRHPLHIEYFSNLTHINDVNQVLISGKSVVSSVYTIEPTKQKVIFMMVPLWNAEGKIAGVVGGILNPAGHSINQLLQSAKVGDNSFIEIIDANEVVIASDNHLRVLNHHDHGLELSNMIKERKHGIVECRHGFSGDYSLEKQAERTADRLAVVPLNIAPWGVIVGQSEKDIFAPAINLQEEFLLLAVIFIGASIVFSFMLTRNIIRPLKLLTASTNKIASGDLLTPVVNMGSDEILTLSKSFDAMRQKLAESLEKIRLQNIELENRVAARTREVVESRKKIEQLLQKVISSQEDERKRIARELHDTILQDISACLIKMDTFRLLPESAMADAIDDIKKIMVKVIDNSYAVIKDMRPAILDDLGIDAAIMWLLDRHLKEKGINYYLDFESPIKGRLSPEVEITLFRILQESIINITRHSNAKNVFVCVEYKESLIEVCIEDDGIGFDSQDAVMSNIEGSSGLGIIGMKERVTLLEGDLKIYSQHMEGTSVCIQIPLKAKEKNV